MIVDVEQELRIILVTKVSIARTLEPVKPKFLKIWLARVIFVRSII